MITIDAGGQSRAFEVGVAGAALNDLGLTGGYHARQGGAVASSGELTMNGVTVSDSYSGKYGSAVYIAPGTSLTVIGSNFTNNISKAAGSLSKRARRPIFPGPASRGTRPARTARRSMSGTMRPSA